MGFKLSCSYISVLSILLFISSCGFPSGQGSGQAKHQVTLAGSTSVMPFTEKLAEHFMIEHPEFAIDVQGGGSSAGIQACLNRTVNVGMSSRELKNEEKVLSEITICHDGIAIVVSPKNPLANITLEQVRGIYSGKIRNWKELGWIDRNIDAVTREEGSGTRAAFEELAMQKGDIDDGIMVQDSNGSVKEVVTNDPYAIGYVSVGIVDAKVKALSLNSVFPTSENLRTRKYRIVRPFLYLTRDGISPDTKRFIDFVLSKDGQLILKKEGLVPVNG